MNAGPGPAAAPTLTQRLAAIQTASERRGVVLTLKGETVCDHDGSPAPDGFKLVKILRAAHAATDGKTAVMRSRQAHVLQLIRGIERDAGLRNGPVGVARTAWVLLCSYAATGAPPKREEIER
jgi:hypothetical protein